MTPIQATIYVMNAMEANDISSCNIELAGNEWRFVITKSLHAAGTQVQTSFSIDKTTLDDGLVDAILAPLVAGAISRIIADIHTLCDSGTLECRFCNKPLTYLDDSTMACAECSLAARNQVVLNIPKQQELGQ